MDHRVLLVYGEDFYLVGGMDGQQRVLSVIGQFRLDTGQVDPRSADRNSKMDKEKARRSEEHTSELQSLMRISYAVFCLKQKRQKNINKERETRYAVMTQ